MAEGKPDRFRPRARWLSRGLGLLAAGAACLAPARAGADIVRFTNGRTMNVVVCRFDGDTVILTLPNGGELQAPRNLVAELLPDEVPYARTVAIEALASSQAAAAAPLSRAAILALASRVAAKVGLDDRLATAVIQVESNFDQRAVSSRGAMGLMQIMPAVAQQYALGDPFEPEQNLEAGMRYLRGLLTRFSDVPRALAAYNAGEGAVLLYGGVPPYRETENYVRRIMAIVRDPAPRR